MGVLTRPTRKFGMFFYLSVPYELKGQLLTARQMQQEWLAAQRTGSSTRGFTHRPGFQTLNIKSFVE
ncbi:hypothetical protein [Nostoc sp.]|uniref:hypothetical protein n=1 Tax=Nostoc sp. TaxID=1180 RepID=UPI002FF4A04A